MLPQQHEGMRARLPEHAPVYSGSPGNVPMRHMVVDDTDHEFAPYVRSDHYPFTGQQKLRTRAAPPAVICDRINSGLRPVSTGHRHVCTRENSSTECLHRPIHRRLPASPSGGDYTFCRLLSTIRNPIVSLVSDLTRLPHGHPALTHQRCHSWRMWKWLLAMDAGVNFGALAY